MLENESKKEDKIILNRPKIRTIPECFSPIFITVPKVFIDCSHKMSTFISDCRNYLKAIFRY